MRLVIDSGGVTRLARETQRSAALILVFRDQGLWPPTLPSVVLVECLAGDPRRDALANRFLKSCDVVEEVPVAMAKRAAHLRAKARLGSAVDALVVAAAEPGGTVLTGDIGDLSALSSHADGVTIERI